MASIPQKPLNSHKKSTSSVSVRTIGREPGDDGEPAGRRRLGRINTNVVKRRNGVELVPMPSEDPKDPLNWPTWRKETTFGSILLSTAVVGIMKSLFVSTNRVIATQFNVSYMATASLTGLPFIFAAFSGLGSSILAAIIGKRSLYVLGGVVMLAGALWNMHVGDNYAQFMVSRIFQGVGWGVTESLVTESIRDLYFVHERNIRTNLYFLTSLIFTWGSPILGGYVSQSLESFREAIMILTLIQAFSIFFLVFFAPETSFTRSSSLSNHLPSSTNIISGPSASPFKTYLSTLKPISYHAPFSTRATLERIRALGAPSAVLAFLLTFPIVATSYGIANSLSLLFAVMPTFLFPSRIGYIFILPLIFSLLTFSAVSITSYFRSKPPKHLTATSNLTAICPGVLLGVSGLLAFGLYVSGELTPRTVQEGRTVFALDTTALTISLKVVSALFGMLVSASIVLSYTVSSHLSTPPSSSNSNQHHYLESSYRVWLDVMTGIFIIAMPTWIEMKGTASAMVGLRDTVIGLGVVQLVLASTVGAVLWVKGDQVRKVDERVMGVRDDGGGVGGSLELRRWESKNSFFDA